MRVRKLDGNRFVVVIAISLMAVTAINLYVHRASSDWLGLVGVDAHNQGFLHDSAMYTYDWPWTRPSARLAWVAVFVTGLICVAVLCVQRALSGFTAGSRPRAAALGLVLGVSGLLLVEVLLHGYVRVSPSDYYSGAMNWRHIPNLQPGNPQFQPWFNERGPIANSFGLRERDIPLEKERNEFRIVCIGDSWTWGAFAPAQTRWTRQLETILQDKMPDRKITVVNAGMAGHTYLQGYLTLTRIGLLYHPDLVIVAWLHDVDGIFPEAEGDVSPLRAAMEQSVLYQILRSRLGGAASGPLPHNYYRLKIAELMAQKGIPTLLIPPMKTEPDHTIPFSVPPSRWSPASPVCAWDVNPADPLFADSDRYLVGKDEYARKTHPAPAGHALIARAVADFLLAHPWVFSAAGGR